MDKFTQNTRVTIQRCIDHLVFTKKFKKVYGQKEKSRNILYNVILPPNVFEDTGDADGDNNI